jgi:hypothetical protein
MSGRALLEADSPDIFRAELQSMLGFARGARLVIQNGRHASWTVDEFPIGLDKTVRVHTLVLARQFAGSNGAVGDSGSWEIVGTFKNIGGTVSQVDSTTVLVTHEDNNDVGVAYFTDGFKVYVQATFSGATDSLGLDYVFTAYTTIHELSGF